MSDDEEIVRKSGELMNAINDGVTRMVVCGYKLPSPDDSFRVANALRRLRKAIASQPSQEQS
jgi:hypothetical protein